MAKRELRCSRYLSLPSFSKNNPGQKSLTCFLLKYVKDFTQTMINKRKAQTSYWTETSFRHDSKYITPNIVNNFAAEAIPPILIIRIVFNIFLYTCCLKIILFYQEDAYTILTVKKSILHAIQIVKKGLVQIQHCLIET